MLKIPETREFELAGWRVHRWGYRNGEEVTVLHREPFRITWAATQLVTYVFLIPREVQTYSEIMGDYDLLRHFAGKNKRTWLPFGFQCGYALLPIYINESFPDPVIQDVRVTFKKHWCVFHAPALLESGTGCLHMLEAQSFWGCFYREYIQSTLRDVADTIIVD